MRELSSAGQGPGGNVRSNDVHSTGRGVRMHLQKKVMGCSSPFQLQRRDTSNSRAMDATVEREQQRRNGEGMGAARQRMKGRGIISP